MRAALALACLLTSLAVTVAVAGAADDKPVRRWRLSAWSRAAALLGAVVLLPVLFGTGAGPAAASPAAGFTWSQLGPAIAPPARVSGAMADDPATGQLVLFGGQGANGSLGDTWTWDGSTWTQQHPATSPPARQGASLAYDAGSAQLVLFGGASGGGVLFGDTWIWDGATWMQLQVTTSPGARARAAMAYDPSNGGLVLFSGAGSTGSLNDTWVWAGNSWTRVSVSGPQGRPSAAMAYDAGSDRLVMFGGGQNLSYFTDTWLWDGSTWVQSSPVGPSGRYGASMSTDPRAGDLVLFGGRDGAGTLRDTWTWQGGGWTQQSPASPSARNGASMAYDTRTSQLVLFGGVSTSFLDETWIFGPPLLTQTIVFTSTPPTNPVAGGSYNITAGGGGSGNPLVFSENPASTPGACSVSPVGVVDFTGVGTCYVNANQAGNSAYYDARQVYQAITIGQGSQSITFTSVPPSSPAVGGTYAAVAGGGPSGLLVVFSNDASSTGGACTVTNAGVVSLTGAGSCTIDANQAGNDSYQPAPQVQQSLNVSAGGPADQVPVARAGMSYLTSVGIPVTLDGSASSDADGDLLTYAWDLDLDGVFGDVTGVRPSWTFAAPGSYPVALKVTDSAGLTSYASYATVEVADHPPVANSGGPYSAVTGTSITLDATASTDQDPGDTLSYAWDLNHDGRFDDATGPQPYYTVNGAAGSTTSVCVKVTDRFGRSDTSCATATAAQVAPMAVIARPVQTLESGSGSLTTIMDGAGSQDPDGDALTFRWSFAASLGDVVSFDDAASPHPTLTLPHTTAARVAYSVHLVVSDGYFTSSADATIYVVDTTPPLLTVPSSVTVEATSTAGAAVTYLASATDRADGPVTPTCRSASGLSNGSTYPIGVTSVDCTAADQAGNTTQKSFTVSVIYRFDGYLQPVNDVTHNPGESPSVFKAGGTVPLKVQLKTLDGTAVQAATAPVFLAPEQGGTTSVSIDESLYTGAPDTGAVFRYDATTAQYVYNWSTSKTQAGHWWRLVIRLPDGTRQYVIVGLR